MEGEEKTTVDTQQETESNNSNNLPVKREETLPASQGQQDAQNALDAVARGDKRANAFNAMALMMRNMRTDLEGIKRTGQLPRWMRIARVREFNKEGATNFIATKAVIPITGGFIKVVGFIAELTMKAQELLTQADGGKALLEVGASMIKTASSDEFFNSVTETVGIDSPGANPLKPVGGIVDTAMEIIDKIPDPEDVEVLAKELYLLLAVEQLGLPLTSDDKVDTTKLPADTVLHVNKDMTGKVRLLSWSLNQPITFGGLSGGVPVNRLGSRRVWEATSGLPTKASLLWEHEGTEQTVYEFDFSTDEAGKDIQEANALFKQLDYTEPTVPDEAVFSEEFARRLRRFQHINALPVTGRLDNATINQLMNLDFKNKTLRRAKSYSAAGVSGFDDSRNPEPEKEE